MMGPAGEGGLATFYYCNSGFTNFTSNCVKDRDNFTVKKIIQNLNKLMSGGQVFLIVKI